MKTKTLPVALVQENNHGDAAANLAVIEARVAEAAKSGARLVLLQELHNGAFVPFAESPARAGAIRAALGTVAPATDHGEAPLLAVHDARYLDFLRSAYDDWRAAGRPGDAGAYAWPVVRRRPLDHDRIDARLGAYSFDASSPIAEGTWKAAYWAAQTALTAHLVAPEIGSTDDLLTAARRMLHDQFGIEHCTLQVERIHLEDTDC